MVLRCEGFNRVNRIVNADDFSSAFRLKPSSRTKSFKLFVSSNNLSEARLGLVISKKYASKAVIRNMIKRLTREIFRKKKLLSNDYVLRLYVPLKKNYINSFSNSYLKKKLRKELIEIFRISERNV